MDNRVDDKSVKSAKAQNKKGPKCHHRTQAKTKHKKTEATKLAILGQIEIRDAKVNVCSDDSSALVPQALDSQRKYRRRGSCCPEMLFRLLNPSPKSNPSIFKNGVDGDDKEQVQLEGQQLSLSNNITTPSNCNQDDLMKQGRDLRSMHIWDDQKV